MEDLLLNLIKEATGPKLSSLRQSAQEAHDLLCSQNNLLRNSSHELRTSTFTPLKLALDTKKSKLVTLALSGLNKIVRDERFQAGSEPEDDSLWLPAQLLHATSSMLSQCEDTQVHILRVVLNLACSASWTLNGRLVMLLISRCGEAYETGTQPIRAAAQAAASQTLTAFCTFLDEEHHEILQQQQKHKNSGTTAEMVYNKTSAVACFNEAIPVMQYICSRLEETKTFTKSSDITVFLLECLLTLVNTLPNTVHSNAHFATFLWQKFCPALLALLGTPGDPERQGLTTHQSKIVYSIGIQVVRLVGRERALRPVLEALFHRMLLLPCPGKRLEPLRVAKELLRSPARLADLLLLSGPLHRHAGDDMAIIRLIVDSIEESSQCNDPSIILASVECVGALLGSLEALCNGEGLDQEGSEIANVRYPTLEQADYTGPLTYQSLARLPKPYRDVVANLRYQSDSDSSGIDGGGQNVEGESDSECSGATEGPEEFVEPDPSDDSIMDDESFLTSQQLQQLHNLPKSLQLGRTGIDECNVDLERHNARHFVKTLHNILLPNLLTLRSSIQIDEYLQEFASKCCQHNAAQNYEITTIMNADGIYLATYSALLLNLKLIQSSHYEGGTSEVCITEAQFVEEIHGSGILVYVSATWLCELYQNVLAKSLLQLAGYDPKGLQQPALINLLVDVGGLCPTQLLTDWQKLQRVRGVPDISAEVEAGIKLSRRVLTCCWTSVVSVLGLALGEKSLSSGGASALSRLVARRSKQKFRQRIKDDVITACLEGLHKAASLSNTLKLQARSSSILGLLSASSCKIQGPKLPASHALSLDVILSKGLSLGSHSAACWPHVFNACIAISSLEHALFSKAGSTQLLMVAQNQNNAVTSTTAVNTSDRLSLSFNSSSDDETCVDVYSFLQNSSYSSNSNSHDGNIAEIVERSGVHNGQGQGILTGVYAAKVCCVLSVRVDELFHSAALRLPLPGFCSFLTELCKASYAQLFAKTDELPSTKKWWKKELEARQKPPATLLLHRIGEVTLKCIRSGRPLIHTMKVWSIVGPHFMQAACHKDPSVSKKAITCIHDSVTALLNEQTELPHFHFNEALFKPFENLLCLEMCDADVQDQIVSCLCEFVEGNRIEICSGWRPLFGTLRVANGRNNSAAILEVFKVFLSTDNTLVFANAALDYIMCLLSHIRHAEGEKFSECISNVSDKNVQKNIFLDTVDERKKKEGSREILCEQVNLCLESLKLLENCATILSMMYYMPKCPTFNLNHRVKTDTSPQLVDSAIPNPEVVSLPTYFEQGDNMSYEILSPKIDLDNCMRNNMMLPQMDKPSGVVKIWFALLEGLATTAVLAEERNQPYVLETLFKLLRDLIVNPGINFGLYCINHLLLPMVQSWLRQNMKIPKVGDNGQHFKHYCGMATELVVEYLHTLQEGEEDDNKPNNVENPGASLALKQLLLILNECVAQPLESIARLGASCMRHLIINVGQILTTNQWEILITAIHRSCAISLNPLQQITSAFKPNSDSFYGDLATVKVAARRDSTPEENERLYELAQQVLLMHSQKNCNKCFGKQCDCEKLSTNITVDDRSYVFLLFPLEAASSFNPDLFTIRVPFRNLVLGILAHQMLIQTISSALLQNLNHVTPILKILQINSCSLRGILTHVNAKHVNILLRCLEMSNERAKEFDSRPGLKFLMQKVGNLSKSANLYTQANTSEVVEIIVLIELCLDGIDKYSITPNQLKEILSREDKEKCCNDVDYVEQFLRKLQAKWEFMCDSYVNLSINIPNAKEEYAEQFHPSEQVKVIELKRSESFCSSDSESYLDKNFLPNLNNEEILHDTKRKEKERDRDSSNGTDDEASEDNSQVHYKVKYDTNTLIQIQSSTSSESLNQKLMRTNKEIEEKVGALMEQYRKHKTSHVLEPNLSKIHPNLIPPPQPIPPEIQQQRAISIFKDSEAYKSARIETVEACMELLSSLSSEKLSPLATILKEGAVMLVGAQDEKVKLSAEKLLHRMNISYVEDDNIDV
ncbi:hypothetical protein PPYR_14825 [Photinus pyralis]|uniref:SEC7 domain-containing protein n=4 Tax=Photinus pyralis TaxID=7054 RepID=A0A5N4A6A2_PHOPY|nr:brefeldin A-inhibited guanine nucleotide-exchange protein 3 [Photinus pyralis]KAB0792866.1 hypothetical protein PPYR_14825 [Photinus pyralis]